MALRRSLYPLRRPEVGVAVAEGRCPPGAGLRGGGLSLVTNLEDEPYPPFFSRLPVVRPTDPAGGFAIRASSWPQGPLRSVVRVTRR
jgi:hypothetical protein